MRTVRKRISLNVGTLFFYFLLIVVPQRALGENTGGGLDSINGPANPKVIKRINKRHRDLLSTQSKNAPKLISVVNAASFLEDTSPGSLIALFGVKLSTSKQACLAPANKFPIPLKLCGTQVILTRTRQGSVVIPQRALPLLYVGGNQINAQLPFELAQLPKKPSTVTLQVKTSKGSSSLRVSFDFAGVGMLTQDASGTKNGVISHFDHGVYQPYSMVTDAAPARPGETVLMYATGLGGVGVTGAAFDERTRSPAIVDVIFTRGSVGVGSTFSERVPVPAAPVSGLVGIYQINFTIPNRYPWNATQSLGPLGITIFVKNPSGLRGSFSQKVLLPLADR